MPGAGETGRVVARLSPESKAASGQTATLWLDAERLHLFDAHDGSRLSVGEKAAGESGDGAPKAWANGANGANGAAKVG